MLKELIRYTEVADGKVIDAFLQAGKPLEEAERLFCHVLNAQHIWVNRIRGTKCDIGRFDRHQVKDFNIIHQRNIEDLYTVLAEGNLSAKVTYSTSTGDVFTDIVSDILFHVVNHSTYHRAQVATQFRINGINPPATDYIFLKRQGGL